MVILFENVLQPPTMIVANSFRNRKSKSIPGRLCIIRTETLEKCTGIKRYSIRRITDRKIAIAKQKSNLSIHCSSMANGIDNKVIQQAT